MISPTMVVRCGGALLGAMALVACSGGGDDAGPAGLLGALEEVVVATHCGKRATCCKAGELAGLDEEPDVASCRVQALARFRGYLLPAVMSSVAAGRTELDEERLRVCQAVLANADCADFTRLSSRWELVTCPGWTRGLVANGEACRFNHECKSGRCAEPAFSFPDPAVPTGD